jgi:hypothetical protein
MVTVPDGGYPGDTVLAAYGNIDGILRIVRHLLCLALCANSPLQIAALDDARKKKVIGIIAE